MIRPIQIDAVLNGYIVKVNCQTVVFSTVHDLTAAIGVYLRNPDTIEKQYMAYPNAKHTMDARILNDENAPPTGPLDMSVMQYNDPANVIEILNESRDLK